MSGVRLCEGFSFTMYDLTFSLAPCVVLTTLLEPSPARIFSSYWRAASVLVMHLAKLPYLDVLKDDIIVHCI